MSRRAKKAGEIAASTPLSVWEAYRPKGPVNFSDLIEDETIDARSTTASLIYGDEGNNAFAPDEITGRSTCLQDAGGARNAVHGAKDFSVDMILGDSFVKEVRSLSKAPSEVKRLSSLPKNCISDSSVANADMAWKHLCTDMPSQAETRSDSICSGEFVPFDQVNASESHRKGEY